MASTYVNDLRLEEMATGDQSGTWGDTTNTNLELIAEAFSYGTQASFGSDADATTTIADGASDPARSLYLKITSGVSLTATRTLTIAPNTVSKVWIIENATSGSQSISISQGSGANVTIPNGDVKVVYSDGAGSGAAVVDAFTSLSVGDLTATNLTGTLATAAQTNITSVGALDGGSITSGFGSIDVGSSAITTTGTVTGGTLAGTLATAAQPNITSVGTLTALTGGTGDLNWDSGTLFVDSSANSVGIGTASPTDKVQILDSGNLTLRVESSGASNQSAVWTENNSGSINGMFMYGSSHPTYGAIGAGEGAFYSNVNINIMSDSASGTIKFSTGSSGGSEKMRIDSSGNVGIGTTSPDAKLRIDQDAAATGLKVTGGNGGVALAEFTRDIGSTGTVEINAVAGDPQIKFASANNTFSIGTNSTAFEIADNDALGTNARFTINSVGNVGIGTSSPDKLLHLAASSGATLRLESTTTGATTGDIFGAIEFETQDSNSAGVKGKIDSYSEGGVGNAALRFFTGNTTELGERMRIDSSGRLLVNLTSNDNGAFIQTKDAGSGCFGWTEGTSAVDARIFANTSQGAVIATQSAHPLALQTSGQERMRIGSTGNLLVGNTGLTGCKMSIYNSGVDALRIALSDNSASSTSLIACFSDSTTTAYGTLRLNIVASGNVTNSNNSYGGISDEKLKENIVDATDKLEDLKQVRIRNYNFIGEDKKQIGVIAQELETIFPNMVEETPDLDNDNNDLGTTTKSVKYSVFVPILIKAIQEQQELINNLTARIEQLENQYII